MFLNAGLRPMIEEESFKAWDQTMGMLEDLARTIQPSGAKLRVVVMPSKWRLHEEKLRGRGPGPDRRDLYSKVIQGLAERSIDAPNVLDLLKAYRRAHKGDQLFSPCDTHFSRLGFRVVTAEAIAGLMGISPNAAKGRMSRLPRVASSYHGDLLDLMSLGADSAVGRRFAYEEESLIVPPCFNQKGARVLVFGDSFVEAYNGLLPGLIQAATGLTVDARYALWSPANQAALFKDYAAQPAHFVVMALTERLFGSQ
jgi:hypothetical protein